MQTCTTKINPIVGSLALESCFCNGETAKFDAPIKWRNFSVSSHEGRNGRGWKGRWRSSNGIKVVEIKFDYQKLLGHKVCYRLVLLVGQKFILKTLWIVRITSFSMLGYWQHSYSRIYEMRVNFYMKFNILWNLDHNILKGIWLRGRTPRRGWWYISYETFLVAELLTIKFN